MMAASDWLDEHEREVRVATARRCAGTGRRWQTLGTPAGRCLRERAAGCSPAGNGGSAAEAQHLTAELVGRFLEERAALSAICLQRRDLEPDSHRQRLRRRGDVRPAGRGARSPGRRTACCCRRPGAARTCCTRPTAPGSAGIVTWAMTGPGPNPLSARCDDAVLVRAPVNRRHPGGPSRCRARIVCGGRCGHLGAGGSRGAGLGVPRRRYRAGRCAPTAQRTSGPASGAGFGADRMTPRAPGPPARRTWWWSVTSCWTVTSVGTAERLARTRRCRCST